MTAALVGRGEADSVAAHTNGYSLAMADTTVRAIDLSLWIGRYVKLVAQGQSVYYVFANLIDGAVPVSPVLVTGNAPIIGTGLAATGTPGVADIVSAGGWEYVVISAEAPVFVFRAGTAGAQISVIPK